MLPLHPPGFQGLLGLDLRFLSLNQGGPFRYLGLLIQLGFPHTKEVLGLSDGYVRLGFLDLDRTITQKESRIKKEAKHTRGKT